MYEIKYDCDRGLFKIILSETYTNNIEEFVNLLAKIAETINPMPTGVELAEHIKKFKPQTREEKLGKAIDCEDTKLLQQQFPNSTLIDAVYYSCNVKLIFKYLYPEDVRFLFEFGLIYDYDIDIKRRKDTEETFEVTLREND